MDVSDLFASETFVTLEDRPEIVAGYRTAPAAEDSFLPWVTILQQRETTGELRWEFGPDAVLMPVRRVPEPDRPRSRRRFRRRGAGSPARPQ